MNLFIIFLIAISLSMDAFSLAITIGTLKINFKYSLILSITVGLFHFFMPLLGSLLGTKFINILSVNTDFLTSIIFMYIAIQMFKEYKNEVNFSFKLNLLSILIFALSVSLDSFGIGFTYDIKTNMIYISFLIFSLCSGVFTFLGLYIGKKFKSILGNVAILLGSSILLILSIINFVKFCSFN